MNKDTLGLYLHIPFCVQKCRYCDFCSFASSEAEREAYVSSLLSEILHAPEDRREVDSIFFGGGTPSLLTEDAFSRIFSALRKRYCIAANAEITVEMNPGTVTGEKLSALRALGVNRVSMGLQSSHNGELSALGRIHTYEQFLESFSLVRASGIENINIDLMYAIPHQNVQSFKETLSRVIALSPSHISAYSLIIEEGTPFYRDRESLVLPSEEEEAEMYALACEMLGAAGYRHYEISNYAKEGSLCRHNLRYWQGGDYLGFGLAAHSLYRGERMANTEDFKEYLENPHAYAEREKRDTLAEAEEYVMLGLRTSFGISLFEYRERFGKDLLEEKKEAISLFFEHGLLSIREDRLSLTEKGFYLSNTVLCELLSL